MSRQQRAAALGLNYPALQQSVSMPGSQDRGSRSISRSSFREYCLMTQPSCSASFLANDCASPQDPTREAAAAAAAPTVEGATSVASRWTFW